VRLVAIPESIWRLQNIADLKLKSDSNSIVQRSHVHGQLPPPFRRFRIRYTFNFARLPPAVHGNRSERLYLAARTSAIRGRSPVVS